MLENAAALDDHGLPVDVVQIDDGWSLGIGEWLAAQPAASPSLARLVGDIRDTGRRAGIWLAPFFVAADSDLAARAPRVAHR